MKPGAGDVKKADVKVGAEVDRKDETPIISFITSKQSSTTVDMTPIIPQQDPLVAVEANKESKWTCHYVMTILTTIFCFGPLSVIGLVHFLAAKTHQKQGNMAEARKRKRQAKCWSLCAFLIGLLILIICAVMLTAFGWYISNAIRNLQEIPEDYEEFTTNSPYWQRQVGEMSTTEGQWEISWERQTTTSEPVSSTPGTYHVFTFLRWVMPRQPQQNQYPGEYMSTTGGDWAEPFDYPSTTPDFPRYQYESEPSTTPFIPPTTPDYDYENDEVESTTVSTTTTESTPPTDSSSTTTENIIGELIEQDEGAIMNNIEEEQELQDELESVTNQEVINQIINEMSTLENENALLEQELNEIDGTTTPFTTTTTAENVENEMTTPEELLGNPTEEVFLFTDNQPSTTEQLTQSSTAAGEEFVPSSTTSNPVTADPVDMLGEFQLNNDTALWEEVIDENPGDLIAEVTEILPSVTPGFEFEDMFPPEEIINNSTFTGMEWNGEEINFFNETSTTSTSTTSSTTTASILAVEEQAIEDEIIRNEEEIIQSFQETPATPVSLP